MKPICVKCQRFFRPKKTGFRFTEGMPNGTGPQPPEPGTGSPSQWQPYKLWIGDLWECQGCGAQIVSGFAAMPVREHYQPDFAEVAERGEFNRFQVNDC